MNKMPFSRFAFAAVMAAFLLLPACEKPFEGPNTIQGNGKQFDIDVFETKVVNGLGNQWAGYAYAISQNGQLKRDGVFGKRISVSDGNVNFEVDSPIYGASVNKVMTAVAMLKILEAKGNGSADGWLNASIAQFLPPNWNFGPNSATITFRQLIQHRSGIASNAAIDYSGLRTLIATGTSADKSYNYSNANYALLRILIARMGSNVPANSPSDATNATNVLAGFRKYMEDHLFDPFNIKVNTRPFGSNPALYYGWGNLSNGWNMGDMTSRLGNGGFYFSTLDAAKFLSFLNHSEQIISKNTRQLMYDQFLGWSDGNQPQNEPNGVYGTYYFKNGSFCSAVDGGGCSGRGVRNIIAAFPHNGVEVVIMANSRGGNMDNSTQLRAMLRNAYDNAWVKK
jgi:CubicO group peptidase (beta-lactamase class C family)